MKGNHKGNKGNSDHRSQDNIHSKHNMDEAVQHTSGDDTGTAKTVDKQDVRQHTDHSRIQKDIGDVARQA